MVTISNIKEIKFIIFKEYWNEYKLSDGSEIRIRIIVTKAYQKSNAISLEFTNPIVVVSSEILGENGKEPIPNEYLKASKEEITVLNSLEYWNEYELPSIEKKIKIKYVLSDIHRLVDRFNNQGFPFYLVNGGPLIEYIE